MRSQPPLRLLQSIVLAFGALALLAFYVALSAPSAQTGAQAPATAAGGPPPATVTPLPPRQPTQPPAAASGPALPFTVVDDGAALAVSAPGPSIGEALVQAGIVVYLADEITPSVDARLTAGLTVVIDRSQAVTIEVDGNTVRTRVSPDAATVADALAEARIALGGLDYTLPAAGSPMPADGVILVKRVVEQVITTSETIPFNTLQEPRPDMELDTSAVVQEGREGIVERTILIRYENGLETGRALQQEVVTQQPQDHIVGYGTNIVIRTLDTPDGPLQYWRKIFVRVTSYSAARSGTPTEAPWYGRTRTGKPLTRGIVAVDPTVIALGTRLYVLGYGFGTADDTGSGIHGKFVDLGYDDAGFEHWYGHTDVYLLAPPPPPEQIVWVLP